MRDESLFGNIDKMLELVRVSNTIENDGGVTRGHVVALESIIPGIITSRHSTDSFTHGVSNYNNDTAYACVNQWALENGLPEEGVATESWGNLIKAAAGIGLFAGLIALITLIVKMFRGGSSGGGSSIKSSPSHPDKVMAELDTVIETVDKKMKAARTDQSAIKETNKKKVEAVEKLVETVVTSPPSVDSSSSVDKSGGLRGHIQHARVSVLLKIYAEYKRLGELNERYRKFCTRAGYGSGVMRDTKAVGIKLIYIHMYTLGKLEGMDESHELFSANLMSAFRRLPGFLTGDDYKSETAKYSAYIKTVTSDVMSAEAIKNLDQIAMYVSTMYDANADIDAILAKIEETANSIPIPPELPVGSDSADNRDMCKKLLSQGRPYIDGIHENITALASDMAKVVDPSKTEAMLKSVTALNNSITAAAKKHTDDEHVAAQLRRVSSGLTSVYRSSLAMAMSIHKYALERATLEEKNLEMLAVALELRLGEPFIAYVLKYLPNIADYSAVDSHTVDEYISTMASKMSSDDFASTPKYLNA